jgi:hypothetical protein
MSFQELKPIRWLVGLAKNSPWLMMAIGLHVILAAVMSVIVIRHERAKANESATQIKVTARAEAPEEVVQPPEELDRKKIPDNDVQAELVTYEEEQTFVPTEEVVEEDLYLDIGDPTGTDDGSDASTGGTSIGVGSGGHYGTGSPSTFLSRRPGTATGRKKGRQGGATVGTEEAVLEGLRWLLRHQNEDGSWSPSTVASHCTKTPCIPADAGVDDAYDVGMTAMCLLAFLGQGISTSSKLEIVDTAMGVKHQAGEAVKKGVRWLMDRQNEDGSFSDGHPFELPENETLATMVMCEAYGLSHNRELKRPAQKALDFLVAAQKEGPDGTLSGWGLGSRADMEARHASGELDDVTYEETIGQVDLSITCWVAMALRSAQNCGLEVSEDVLTGALNLALSSADEINNPDQASLAPGKAGRRAAFGMLIRSFVSRDVTDAYLEEAAALIAGEVPHVSKDGSSIDFYYWHFGTLALNQYDGPDSPREGQGQYWEPWNKGLIESLLRLQDDDQSRDACSRGGWLSASRNDAGGKALYNTAMNVLTLEVYYRFENVFGAMPAQAAGNPVPSAK